MIQRVVADSSRRAPEARVLDGHFHAVHLFEQIPVDFARIPA